MENLKLCEIITSGDYGSMTDLTDNQRKFVTLHTEICRKGAYVVSGMVEFAEKLKEMRDGKSYVEAGFESFGEYCEKAVGIKTSMAYRYVKVYEDLPKDFLYSNTKLGITKLSLLARLDKEEREELTGTVDVENVSVEELRKAIEERDAKISQLELTASETESENAKKIKKSEDDAARAKKSLEKALKERDEYSREIEKLKSLPKEVERITDPETVAKLEAAEKALSEKDEEIARLNGRIKIASDTVLTKFGVKFGDLQVLSLRSVRSIAAAYRDYGIYPTEASVDAVLYYGFNKIVQIANDATTVRKILKYVRMQNRKNSDADFGIYYDYIVTAEKLNFDIKSKEVLFPKDLMRAHDRVIGYYKVAGNVAKRKDFMTAIKNYANYSFEDEEKYIDLITEPNLLELWAKKFHNCSYGYCDRIINGKCVIFLVRLKAFPEYPFCMFELETGSCRVVQARDRHNHKVSKYIEDFIYGFVDEMKLRVKYAEH